jgi:2-dehydropantoate 2-reductase
MARELAENGLYLKYFKGFEAFLEPTKLALRTDPEVLGEADIVLLTVKSGATRGMAEEIGRHARAGVVVASLQNGVRNAALVAEAAPHARVLSAMVPFNVVHEGQGRLHRATEGRVMVQAGIEDRLVRMLDVPGVGARSCSDIQGVQWGKLLMNLNNALNALSDLPLKTELSDRRWRRVLADMMDEGLAVARAAAIRPRRVGKVLPALAPTLLRLPDFLFERAAAAMLAIDPEARSSMWEDLQRGYTTEVRFLQGEIVELGAQYGVPTPLNKLVLEAVEGLQRVPSGKPQGLTPEQLRSAEAP